MNNTFNIVLYFLNIISSVDSVNEATLKNKSFTLKFINC